MNKNLISLAVAAALSAPLAVNAAPTLYGQLQAEVADIDRDGGTNDTMEIEDQKRGRLGVKGDEDLGDGLKAIYKFEWQVETTTGDVDDGDREGYVGLSGSWGQITAGALQGAYKYYGGVSYDPLVATLLEARNNGGMFSTIGNADKQFGTNSFLTNAISYKGNFGPAEVWVAYKMSESGTSANGDDYVVGAKFKAGSNAEVIVAYAADNDQADTADSTNAKIGGQMKFGDATVSLQYEQHSDDTANEDATAWFVGAQFKVGKGNIVAQLGQTDSDDATEDVDYAALAYVHKYSANTRGWIGYRTSDGDTNNTLDVDVISIGLRVDF